MGETMIRPGMNQPSLMIQENPQSEDERYQEAHDYLLEKKLDNNLSIQDRARKIFDLNVGLLNDKLGGAFSTEESYQSWMRKNPVPLGIARQMASGRTSRVNQPAMENKALAIGTGLLVATLLRILINQNAMLGRAISATGTLIASLPFSTKSCVVAGGAIGMVVGELIATLQEIKSEATKISTEGIKINTGGSIGKIFGMGDYYLDQVQPVRNCPGCPCHIKG